jgi:glutaredoxin
MGQEGETRTSTMHFAALTPGRFRAALAVLLGAAFVILQALATTAPPPANLLASETGGRLHVFFHPQCPHCHEAIAFLKSQPGIEAEFHDVSTPGGEALLRVVAAQHGMSDENIAVPLFVRGSRYLVGFESAETTGREVLALAVPGGMVAPQGVAQQAMAGRIRLPLLGDIDPSEYSLVALTALLGLADGFNPCAMWVLIYLISLIAGIKEPRKIWWLVGTFVFASGTLYFVFMTAWLNTFLIIGYIRPLTQFVALAAIGFGADHLYTLIVERGVVACQVGDPEQRQRTMLRIREVVAAPVGFASLVLVTGLAFTVNAIEFVCSAALPAIYTHTLALMHLSTIQYYGYIALYVIFFMLDDLVIFGLAAFAVQKVVDTRYAAVSRAAGGVILIGVGVWMLWR